MSSKLVAPHLAPFAALTAIGVLSTQDKLQQAKGVVSSITHMRVIPDHVEEVKKAGAQYIGELSDVGGFKDEIVRDMQTALRQFADANKQQSGNGQHHDKTRMTGGDRSAIAGAGASAK